jgi:hypothetical protein
VFEHPAEPLATDDLDTPMRWESRQSFSFGEMEMRTVRICRSIFAATARSITTIALAARDFEDALRKHFDALKDSFS